MKEDGNSIVAQGSGVNGLMPLSVDDKMQMAKLIVDSGIVPTSLDTPAKVFVALQVGHELGLSPMMSVNNISAINGKVVLAADLMVGLIQQHPQFVSIDTKESGNNTTDFVVSVTIKRDIRGTVHEYTSRFSYQDAMEAGLTKKTGPWQLYPKRMVRHRAKAYAVREAFPDVLAGLYSREEMDDTATYSGPTGPTEEELIIAEINTIVNEAFSAGKIDEEMKTKALSEETLGKYRAKGTLDEYRAYLKHGITKKAEKNVSPEKSNTEKPPIQEEKKAPFPEAKKSGKDEMNETIERMADKAKDEQPELDDDDPESPIF